VSRSDGLNLALGLASVAGIVGLATGRVAGSAARTRASCTCLTCRYVQPNTAYHGITRDSLDAIRRTGLRGHPEHGDGWLYFSDMPEPVISGGYGNYLLSFPWPKNARPSPDGWSHRVRGTIDPRTIDLWYGEADAGSPLDFEWDNGDPHDEDTWRRLGAIDPADRTGSRAVDGLLQDAHWTRYYHVTQAENVPTILREGLRGSDGICGFGVYLWDSLEHAEEMAENEGGVILVVNPGDARLARCRAKDVEREGDADYYDHVAIVRTRPGRTWRPASIRARRGSAARAVGHVPGLHLVEGPSPLDYGMHHGEPVRRLSLHVPGLAPPNPTESRFARTEEKLRTSPVTGRSYKVPKIIVIPGCAADPVFGECVGFLDYHVLPDTGGAVYLDFYTVRSDQRGRGYGTQLVDAFYAWFPTAPWISWGRVVSERAWTSLRRIQATPGVPRSSGKRW